MTCWYRQVVVETGFHFAAREAAREMPRTALDVSPAVGPVRLPSLGPMHNVTNKAAPPSCSWAPITARGL